MQKKAYPLKYSILIIGFFLSVFVALSFGSVNLSINEIINCFKTNTYDIASAIIFDIRLPRLIVALFVGANLAASGALLQTVMQNPLADPGITGVSSGASFLAIIIILLFPNYIGILPIAAFLGGSIACLLVYLLAWKNGLKPLRIVLAGVAVNAIFGGATGILSILNSDKIQGVLLWTNGSMANASWQDVKILIPYSLIGLTLCFFLIRPSNVLQLGEDVASNLGYKVNHLRILLSAVAILLAAISVSVVGIIGFVGLLVPHICRIIFGSDYKHVLPTSMLTGSTLLLLGDTFARTIASPIELPVGTIMAILGGPFFLYLLRKEKKI